MDVVEIIMVVAATWMGYQLTDAIEYNDKEINNETTNQ